MKIKNIDRETKNSKKKYLVPIAKAALGLGITTVLIKTGMKDYDAMLNWESLSDMINNISIDNPLGLDINTAYNLVKTVVTTFGMNTIMIASKGLNFTKEVIKPIVESERVQNNPTVLKIKEVLKGKNKKNNEKQPKALVNLAKSSLALGFKAYLILTGQIDYNSVYDLTQLPHKFVNIARIAENIDLNKLKMGMETLKILPKFVSERKQEKKDGASLIPKLTFKDIFTKILKEFPPLTKVSDLAYVEGMTTNQQPEMKSNNQKLEDR